MSHIILFTIVFLLAPNSNIYAQLPNCPSSESVKRVKFIEAIQHALDPDVWNFASSVITHEGTRWNIWFGSFFPNTNTTEEALKKGQAYFDKINLRIKEPEPYPGTGAYIFCDYMPPGDEFWVSSVSPPAYGKVP